MLNIKSLFPPNKRMRRFILLTLSILFICFPTESCPVDGESCDGNVVSFCCDGGRYDCSPEGTGGVFLYRACAFDEECVVYNFGPGLFATCVLAEPASQCEYVGLECCAVIDGQCYCQC
jgi:hypothetical protein